VDLYSALFAILTLKVWIDHTVLPANYTTLPLLYFSTSSNGLFISLRVLSVLFLLRGMSMTHFTEQSSGMKQL